MEPFSRNQALRQCAHLTRGVENREACANRAGRKRPGRLVRQRRAVEPRPKRRSPAMKALPQFAPRPRFPIKTTPRPPDFLPWIHAHVRKARELRRQQLAEHFSMRADRVQSDVFRTNRTPSHSAQMPGTLCVPASPASGVNSGMDALLERLPVPPASSGRSGMPAYEITCPLRPVERLVPRHAQKRCMELPERYRQDPRRL